MNADRIPDTGLPNQAGFPEREKAVIPPVVVYSGGKGQLLWEEINASLRRQDKAQGIKIVVADPGSAITDGQILELGFTPDDLVPGRGLGVRIDNRDVVAWLRRTEEERLMGILRGNPVSFTPADWAIGTAAVACRKMRPIALRLLESVRRGERSFSERAYVRDTAQIGFSSGRYRYFSHPGADIGAQRAEAKEFAKMEQVALFTASALASFHFSIADKERVVTAIRRVYEFGDIQRLSGKQHLVESQNISFSSCRFLANLVLMRVRESERGKIGDLESNCFTNLPGGLDFGNPQVRNLLEFLVVKGNPVLDLYTYDQVFRSFPDWQKRGEWFSYEALASGQWDTVDRIRKGLLGQEQLDAQLRATHEFFVDLPRHIQAVLRYAESGGIDS